jgi:hypothetical protein
MKRGEWIMMAIFLLALAASAVGQKKWDGEGLDSLWSNARNWYPDGTPLSNDDVILDNERILGGYKIMLPSGLNAVTVHSLSILPGPGNAIVVELPSTSIASSALTFSSTGTALRIAKAGIFINNSGASSGNPIVLNGSFYIENGGRYVHRTQRGNATIVSKLLLEPSTYQGVFEFDVPGNAGYTLSVSGKQFGNLLLSSASAGKKSYTGSGTGVLRIFGDLEVGDSSSFTSSLNNNIRIGNNLVVKGRLSINPSLADTINRALEFNGDSSSIAVTGTWTMGNNFNEVLVSRGCFHLKSNLSLNKANASWNIAPSASMMFGNYFLLGPGIMVADSASTLGYGAAEGISTDSTTGNIRLKNLSFHPKTKHVFYGEGTQQTGGRFPTIVASLSVNKPSGPLVLNAALQVTDSLHLDRGNINTDSNHILTFSGSKLQAGNNGFVAGPFRYSVNVAKDLQFPVGKANYFAPVILSKQNNDAALFQVEYHAMGHAFPDSAMAFPLQSVSKSEYWSIKKIFPSDSLPSTDILRLRLGMNSTNNIIGQPMLVRKGSSAVRWELLPLYANNTVSNTVASAPTILASGIYTFGSMFPSALPKESLELFQQERNGFTRLRWTTDKDETVAQYVVEKSNGDDPYAALDSIPSKNKLGKVSYSFDLRSSRIRGNLIRLRSVDKKGRTVYSNILYVRPTSETMRVFPNPVSNILSIGPIKEPQAMVQLLGPLGQMIQTTPRVRENQLEIDVRKLEPGSYYLMLIVDGKKGVFPFIKQ